MQWASKEKNRDKRNTFQIHCDGTFKLAYKY